MTDEKPNPAINAEWMRLYERMCADDGADPMACANSMLTVASLLCETIHGSRNAAARLIVASAYLLDRAKANEPTKPPTAH
jgi:hypothetical protein